MNLMNNLIEYDIFLLEKKAKKEGVIKSPQELAPNVFTFGANLLRAY